MAQSKITMIYPYKDEIFIDFPFGKAFSYNIIYNI